MAGSKINFAQVGQKLGGITAGVVAGGVLKKYLDGTSMKKYSGVLSIAVGVFAPNVIGKKSPMIQHAGDALIAKGINGLLVDKFGGESGFLAGLEDSVAGTDDEYDGVGDYPTYDETIVSGYDESVAGTGNVGSVL